MPAAFRAASSAVTVSGAWASAAELKNSRPASRGRTRRCDIARTLDGEEGWLPDYRGEKGDGKRLLGNKGEKERQKRRAGGLRPRGVLGPPPGAYAPRSASSRIAP